MKLLMIKPNPNLTDLERDILRRDLRDSIRLGILLVDPNLITYEVVEFDSIEVDNPYYHQKSIRQDGNRARKALKDYLKSMEDRKEKKDDNSGNGEENSRSGEEA